MNLKTIFLLSCGVFFASTSGAQEPIKKLEQLRSTEAEWTAEKAYVDIEKLKANWPKDPVARLMVDIPDPELFAAELGIDYGNCAADTASRMQYRDNSEINSMSGWHRDYFYSFARIDAIEPGKICLVLLEPEFRVLTRREALALRIVIEGYGAEFRDMDKLTEQARIAGESITEENAPDLSKHIPAEYSLRSEEALQRFIKSRNSYEKKALKKDR